MSLGKEEEKEQILEIFEDLEDEIDIARINKAIAAGEEELMPWERVEAEFEQSASDQSNNPTTFT